jgi:ligand-binding sensor domain-containing protein
MVDNNERSALRLVAFYLLVVCLIVVFHDFLSLRPAVASLPDQIYFHNLSIKDDLASNRVVAISQSSEGSMWFGSNNGLNRYDGYSFALVSSVGAGSDVVTLSSVDVLLRGHDDLLWIGRGNLVRYDPATEQARVFAITNNQGIKAVVEDASGLLWLGGERFGLRCFDPESEALVASYSQSFEGAQAQADSINTIYPGEDVVWVGSNDGLYVLERHSKQLRRPFDHPQIDHAVISSLERDRLGCIWIGTWDGLYRYDPVSEVLTDFSYSPDPTLKGQRIHARQIHSLLLDSNGNIWVGTDKQGAAVYVVSQEEFHYYPAEINDPYCLGSGAVDTIFEDRDHGLWFAVQGFGVYRFDQESQFFKHYSPNPDNPSMLSYPMVLALEESRGGDLWIATDGGGLNRLDFGDANGQERFTRYRHDAHNFDSLSSDSVIGLAVEEDGDLWIGSWGGGLSKLDPEGHFSHWQKACTEGRPDCREQRIVQTAEQGADNQLASENVFKLYIDSHEQLWVSVWGVGLQVVDLKTETIVATLIGNPAADSDHMRNPNVMAILEDRDGTIWIGGYNGLDHYDPQSGRFVNYSSSNGVGEGLRSDAIFDLHLDREGQLWLATENGLHLFDRASNSFRAYLRADGLASANIVTILEDPQGNLWLGTRSGLSCFNPKSGVVRNFSVEEGLQSNEFTRFSRKLLRSGKMVFGGVNGFNLFDPLQALNQKQPPDVALTELLLFNRPVAVAAGSRLETHISQAEQITLLPSDDTISLRFSALEYGTPDAVHYRYRMDGVDLSWLEGDSSQRMATYTQLSPGHYNFKVQAGFGGDLWGAERSIAISVLPQWWETLEVRISTLIAILLLLALAAWSQKRRIRVAMSAEQQRREAAFFKEKNAHLAQMNNALMEMASEKVTLMRVMVHDLRNPLSIMQLLLHKLDRQSDTIGPAGLREKTGEIAQTISRLISIINSSVVDELSKPEKNLDNCEPFDVNQQLQQGIREYRLQSEEKGILIEYFNTVPKGVMVRASDTKFRQIIDNLLSNGLKFSSPESEIRVTSSFAGGLVSIVVSDQGQGLSADDKNRIFGQGVTLSARPTAGESSSGLGLFSAQRLAHQIGAMLTVESAGIGKGASFKLRIKGELSQKGRAGSGL